MEANVRLKNAKTLNEKLAIQNSLQTLADNVSKENLAYLAKKSERKDFNEKLEGKKSLINTFM